MREEIEKAIGAHALWKGRLKAAIEKGRSEFTVADTAVDNKCDFGQWLQGKVNSDPASKARREKVTLLHREFHKETAQVLERALKGDREGALKAMEPGSRYFNCGARLTAEMMDWKKAVTR